MHTETIDIEDIALNIRGDNIGVFELAFVECQYSDGPGGSAVFEGVTNLTLDIAGAPTAGGRVVIDVCALPAARRDEIDEAIKPLFESYMDDGDRPTSDYRED